SASARSAMTVMKAFNCTFRAICSRHARVSASEVVVRCLIPRPASRIVDGVSSVTSLIGRFIECLIGRAQFPRRLSELTQDRLQFWQTTPFSVRFSLLEPGVNVLAVELGDGSF